MSRRHVTRAGRGSAQGGETGRGQPQAASQHGQSGHQSGPYHPMTSQPKVDSTTKQPSVSSSGASKTSSMPHANTSEEYKKPPTTSSTQSPPNQSAKSSHQKASVEHKAQSTQPPPTTTKPPNTSTHVTPSKPPYHHSSSVDGSTGSKRWHQQEPLRERSRSFNFPWQSQSRVSVCISTIIVHT